MTFDSNLFPVFYAGPISYYSALLKRQSITFEIKEHFSKQTYRNRTCILSANGPLNLSIPVVKTGGKMPIEEVRISYREHWQKDHWNALHSAYGSSPYFEYYDYLFEGMFAKKVDLLLDFNLQIHKTILYCLDLELEHQLSKEFNALGDVDPRIAFNSKGKNLVETTFPSYYQTFSKQGFVADLSILDLLFNLGPEARVYLKKL